MKICILSAEHE